MASEAVPSQIASDDESGSSPVSSIRPHLDTLFAEFARTRPRLRRSPSPRTPRDDPFSSEPETTPRTAITSGKLDLRNLDYISEYDPNLMCPICHVPFISPVTLECDHTFCSSCYDQYRRGETVSRCPTCRTRSSVWPRKASRLIENMCNDLKVECPNEYCHEILSRGVVGQHVLLNCAEERLKCPSQTCGKLTKRKDFVEDQCLHTSHLECECGDLIKLGTGDWSKHKDEKCPKSGSKCEACGERILRTNTEIHVCGKQLQNCPGADYGCDKKLEAAALDAHAADCPLARLAPYLKRQAQLLSSLQDQLTLTKVRNDVLETGIGQICEIVSDQNRRRLDSSGSSVVEEIERVPSPPDPHRFDFTLPAHLRAFTPSPDPTSTSQQHLLALHESLRGNVTNLEADMNSLSAGLSDLDARTSMQIMNETLRIKEDLAHTNAALFSTRAQVQWLLNRERAGQQMNGRGRAVVTGPSASNIAGSSTSNESFDTGPMPTSVVGEVATPSSMANRGGRRLSGGSQERVKL